MHARLAVIQRWQCPRCGLTHQTADARPHVPMHACPRLRGLTTPFVREGQSAKVELREREDYVGGEAVQLDPEQGRPVMSVVTTRDDGQDVVVFAPTAVARSA